MSNDNKLLFPLVAFPSRIRSIVEQTHEENNFPINYIAAALFFAVSVAIGNCRTLIVNSSWKVKPILFMSLLGNPGSAKTHPIKFAMDPFLKLDGENIPKYRKELSEWRRTPLENRITKPIPKQLRVQDITMEAISKLLEESNHGIFVHADELKGWISSFNKYNGGGGDLEQWLSLWSGVPISVNRKTQDDIIFIPDPFVEVIGGLQPGVMPKLFGGEKMDNGFFYRLLFVSNSSDGEPLLWKDFDLPSGLEKDWERLIFHILDDGGFFQDEIVKKDYSFSEEAWTSLLVWQNSIESKNAEYEPEYKTAIFRKIQDYCLRFCLIIHTMREAAGDIPTSTLIDGNTAILATLVADYFYEEAQVAYETVVSGGVNHEKFFMLLNALNDEFTSAQAVAVGEHLGMSRATVYRYLAVNPDDPFLRCVKRGYYEKIK
ncbi:MAG: DUF3987 domain-containing protein [Bacteroidales bacterium]|nr:DUF3987 domain-containing protein [Bacteroidales bacterium]